VHTYEIWNEPNVFASWRPVPVAADYASLVRATYPEIKSVDKRAIVVAGGLSPASSDNGDVSPIDFVTGLYSSGGGRYFDALAFHPYCFPAEPSADSADNAWHLLASGETSIRSIMKASGDNGKQVWLTEFGAPTQGPSVNRLVGEGAQARAVTKALGMRNGLSWAGPIFIYSYKDSGTSASSVEDHFGLVRSDGSHKPAYDAVMRLH